MTDRQTLLKAIIENPEEDAPRLAYADLIQESGNTDDERYAEFIRVQIELSTHPGMNCGDLYCSRRSPTGLCDSCARYTYLARRERSLWSSGSVHDRESVRAAIRKALPDGPGYGLGWCPLLKTHPDTDAHVVTPAAYVDRGFVGSVTVAADWLYRKIGDRHLAAELFRDHPIAAVALCDKSPLTSRPSAVWFRDMTDVSSNWPVPTLENQLVVSPYIINGEIFDLLGGGSLGGHYFRINKYSDKRYRCVEEANKALSDAIVKWGRNLLKMGA